MRIGIDGSNLRSGGLITHAAELLRHGDPLRHGITRVTLWGSAELLRRVSPRPWLDLVHVAMLDGPLPGRVAWQVFMRSRLARAACDVLFSPGATPPGTFRPYVAMSANMLPFDPRETGRYRWTRGWLRALLLHPQQAHAFREADAVIFLTEFARTTIGARARIPATTRTAVIPSGVSPRFLGTPHVSRPLSSYSAEEPFRFLYVSDIHPYKHQWNVVEAVSRLRHEGLPVALDLIGDPVHPASSKHLRHTLAQHRGETFIRIFDQFPHEDLPPIYRDAAAFVFASTCENLPMTLVEAMASGLPVASSDTRPMPDILGEAGTYFDAESASSIEAALRRLVLDAEGRAAAARRGFEEASKYSWERNADDTFALLADVARTRLQERGATHRQSTTVHR